MAKRKANSEPVAAPVLWQNRITRYGEEALILATIDPVTGLAGTDQKLLDSLITDIRLSDLGMDLGTGLNDLLNSLSPDPSLAAAEGEDDIPALPSEPISRLGDLWLLGGYVVCPHCGTVNDV